MFELTVLQSHGSQHQVELLKAEYNDVRATSRVLAEKKVDTLVCAIGVLTPEANETQLNLIQAASDSACTRRFVIGSYDMEHLRS